MSWLGDAGTSVYQFFGGESPDETRERRAERRDDAVMVREQLEAQGLPPETVEQIMAEWSQQRIYHEHRDIGWSSGLYKTTRNMADWGVEAGMAVGAAGGVVASVGGPYGLVIGALLQLAGAALSYASAEAKQARLSELEERYRMMAQVNPILLYDEIDTIQDPVARARIMALWMQAAAMLSGDLSGTLDSALFAPEATGTGTTGAPESVEGGSNAALVVLVLAFMALGG